MMSPAEWLPINFGLLAITGILAAIGPHQGRLFNGVLAGSWCFWIGWNLAHIGCR